MFQITVTEHNIPLTWQNILLKHHSSTPLLNISASAASAVNLDSMYTSCLISKMKAKWILWSMFQVTVTEHNISLKLNTIKR